VLGKSSWDIVAVHEHLHLLGVELNSDDFGAAFMYQPVWSANLKGLSAIRKSRSTGLGEVGTFGDNGFVDWGNHSVCVFRFLLVNRYGGPDFRVFPAVHSPVLELKLRVHEDPHP